MTSATNYDNLVSELYVAYLGRPADYAGQQNFSAALANVAAPTDAAGLLAAYAGNATVKSLVDAFGTSAESQALYGNGSNASFVDAIYENLFDRPAAAAGLSFWTNAIATGELTRGEAALAIAAGAQGTSTQGIADAQTLTTKLTAAQDFTGDLGQSANLAASYVGSAAAEYGREFLLTLNSGPASLLAQEAQQAVNELSENSTGSSVVTLQGGVTTVTNINAPITVVPGTFTIGSVTPGGSMETLTLDAHSTPIAVVLNPSGTSSTAILKISGLNNAVSDSITFTAEQTGSNGGLSQQGNTLVGFQQVTRVNVTAASGDPASLQSWMAVADGAAGSGVSGAAHTVTWFVFQGNTYVLESVAGQTADAGTMAAHNTMVELAGTGYTFAHASGANGTLHLLG
jgi:hypothetical protein